MSPKSRSGRSTSAGDPQARAAQAEPVEQLRLIALALAQGNRSRCPEAVNQSITARASETFSTEYTLVDVRAKVRA